jgi:hypothetical protein
VNWLVELHFGGISEAWCPSSLAIVGRIWVDGW